MFRGHTRWFVLINSKVRKNKPVLIQPNSTLFYLIFWGVGGSGGGREYEGSSVVLCGWERGTRSPSGASLSLLRRRK